MAWVNNYVTRVFQVQPSPANCRNSTADTSTPHETMCVLLGDGSVRTVSVGVSIATWRALITPARGDILGPDWN